MLVLFGKYGGLLRYTAQLAAALQNHVDVVVIAPFGVQKQHFKEGTRVIELNLGFQMEDIVRSLFSSKGSLEFLRVIRREKPDIVHCIDPEILTGLLLPFTSGCCRVQTVHDTHPHIGSRRIGQWVALRLSLASADCVIVHGRKSRMELGTRKVCSIIPMGALSFPLDASSENVPEEPTTLLFFGRIEEYKGLDYLIEAVNEIHEVVPEIKLIIAGGGDFQRYRKLIRIPEAFEIQNRFIDDSEIPLLFRRAAIVVLPYVEGTQSGIVPIAYAFRKPVIVTDVGDIPEVVETGVTGIVVKPADREALTTAIMKLLENPDLRRSMGENAFRVVTTDLSWEKVAERTIQVYREVVGKACRRRRKDDTIGAEEEEIRDT